MRILFVTMALPQQGPRGLTFELASARYRILIPAAQLVRAGHQVHIHSMRPGTSDLPPAGMDFDVAVVSKSFNRATEELARAMHARGAKIVADFCDDHFDNPAHGTHNRNLAAFADILVASTPAMAEAIRKHTGREAVVITDPVEGPRGFPRFAPRLPALRIVWFGHHSNLNGLSARAGELHALGTRMPIHLTVVTTPNDTARALVTGLAAGAPERVRAELVPWSPEATWKAIEEADLAWIPVIDSDLKAVKSPNRLLEPLWAGRLVVADAVPSYLPFSDLVPIGTGLEKGVTAVLEDPARVERNVAEAQRRVARVHSPFECGRQWAQALGDTAERALRLNLGCGDKILSGYVNVDVVAARAGMTPDVICDLHDLVPFDDNSADEILSVHVVEHFWRWEVRDVLREWVRVLKPGGRMVVECPNLLSACETFLQNPDLHSREDKNGQRTMWVFYGDPAWKDPLMIHRWGYTPDSLKALLSEVGLVNVHPEPAQYKLREPRDMRIVGTKP